MRGVIVSGLMTGLLLTASPASAELPKLSDMQFARMVATVILSLIHI